MTTTDAQGGAGVRVGPVEWAIPIVGAPMAGGPTTPELVAAVSNAGGLGTLAAGYLTAEQLEPLLVEVGELTDRPFGVNLFLPGTDVGEQLSDEIAEYRTRLQIDADTLGTEVGNPRFFDEDIDAKLAVLARYRPAFVSTTFADPGRELVDRIRAEVGAQVFVTVTSPGEAAAAVASGADALIAQGVEAGGHRGIWHDVPDHPHGGPGMSTAGLVRKITKATEVPVIAAGGVGVADDVRELLDAGATAVAVGTALLCADEAGTSETYRNAVWSWEYRGTVVTRAFSGRPARALANRFATMNVDAPAAYPHVHYMTKPIRTAAAAAGNTQTLNLWAGDGWDAVQKGSAAQIIANLTGRATD